MPKVSLFTYYYCYYYERCALIGIIKRKVEHLNMEGKLMLIREKKIVIEID